MSRIWAVCSGSGGVGKTMLALSLAVSAAKAKKQVILLDASGLSHAVDLALGMESVIVLDMADVASGEVSLEAALYPVPNCAGLRLASASLYEGTALSELSGVILALGSMCDILVLDLPTGNMTLGNGLLRQGDELIYVTRPDDASVRAVERLLRRTGRSDAAESIVVNRARKDFRKRGIQMDPSAVAMVLDTALLGVIPEDDALALGVRPGHLPGGIGPAFSEISRIATQLLNRA